MQNVAVSKEKNIFSIFPELKDNIERSKYIENAKIKSINVYRKTKKIELNLEMGSIVPPSVIYSLHKNLERIFEVNTVVLKLCYLEEFTIEYVLEKYWQDIIFVVSCMVMPAKLFLKNATYTLKDNKLVVNLVTRGLDILVNRNCGTVIESLIEEYFGKKIRVQFIEYTVTTKEKEDYIKQKEKEEYKLVTDTLLDNAYGDINQTVANKEKVTPKNRYVKQKMTSSDIFGKVFNEPITKIVDITQDLGDIALNGEVFRIETKELQNGKVLFMFDVTDYTSSITCKMFLKEEEYAHIKDIIKDGTVLKIKGLAQYDKYIRETSIFVTDIMHGIEQEKRMDNASKKRVELHLHTQMSAMDGVSSAKDLIKRAKEWGHKAIAITDHGVVQAYPEAMDAAKKNGIKVI